MSPGRTLKTRGTFVAEIIANERLCDEHFCLRLRADEFPPSRAGQFVQLQCCRPAEQGGLGEVDWPEGKWPKLAQPELTRRHPLLRRPFSLAGRRDVQGGVELDVIYRTIGAGTARLAGLQPAERLSVLGPLGNGFTLGNNKPAAVLVGGGVGIPPLLYLAEALASAGKDVTAFVGSRSANLLPLELVADKPPDANGKPALCIRQFSALGIEAAVATDDGTLGVEGFVSGALARWLGRKTISPGSLVVYSCGPEAMMAAVADTCIAAGIECQLALERYMACGMGTCQSCVVKIRDESEQGWSFKLCCTDGPVFDARDVLW
ncbi:MAG: dihydroorotate dehydrogenase electron transfer subunit [Planctomycetota bacterium]|nr:dihydroorotate dehydrogenase electron transfer subunit [Planctomycetota bacterium]